MTSETNISTMANQTTIKVNVTINDDGTATFQPADEAAFQVWRILDSKTSFVGAWHRARDRERNNDK